MKKKTEAKPNGAARSSEAEQTYEPPLSKKGSALMMGSEPVIAPGVRGYAVRSGSRIFIPLIVAEKQGNGDVGRFLDSLSPRCIIPNVTSARLKGMLQRRGWRPRFDGECDIWERRGEGAKRHG